MDKSVRVAEVLRVRELGSTSSPGRCFIRKQDPAWCELVTEHGSLTRRESAEGSDADEL